jgi:hypothetical protein
MPNVLRHWIIIGTNAYDEYTFVPWLNKNARCRGTRAPAESTEAPTSPDH